MNLIQKIFHKQIVAKLKYYKKYAALKIPFNDFFDYLNKKIIIDNNLFTTTLFGVHIKRINSYSFIHTVEALFIDEIYKFKSSDTHPLILDCGANIGLSIIYFKRLFPTAKIIAFEPDKLMFQACEYNINAFGIKDVELIDAAVWKFDGVLNFLPDNALGGMIVEDVKNNQNVHQVRSVDFKNYLNQDIDFLKIDIEGAELEVLKDCKSHLLLVKNLFVEYHGNVNEPQQLQEILSILTNAGFRYYIKPAWDYMTHPFTEHENYLDIIYDLQLNIFAYRDTILHEN